eukprot:TRINITY_DN4377_c0_g1_i2.p1 TRINITY_DN4377_c0_g1~~TRINITY_DN4377_c0_g1_i2.p1  ORF type:complete len:464 (+),score=121.81 TRINITY_DN4377_c0_g1_i2:36-1394(+)
MSTEPSHSDYKDFDVEKGLLHGQGGVVPDNDGERFTYDYAMVFKKPEEEHKGEVPMMTAGKIQHRIEKAGLKTLLYLSSSEQEVIMLIGAPEGRLEAEAENIEYTLKLNPTRAIDAGNEAGFTLARVTVNPDEFTKTITSRDWENLYGRFNLETKHLYETYSSEGPYHADSVFTAVDRLKLTLIILEADVKAGGAGLSIPELIRDKHAHLKAFFALHDPRVRDELKTEWLSWRRAFRQPLTMIRSYFGEEIALYFSFLQFYNFSLIFLSILGIIFFGMQFGYNQQHPGAAKGVWVYGIIVAIWSTLLMEFWKRREARHRMEWGMNNFEDKEADRPEFIGDPQRSTVTGKIEKFYPSLKKVLKRGLSGSVISMMILMVVAAVISIFIIRKLLNQKLANVQYATYIAAFINAFQIQLFNQIYARVAVYFTNFGIDPFSVAPDSCCRKSPNTNRI